MGQCPKSEGGHKQARAEVELKTCLALFQENIACRPKSFKKVVIIVRDQELTDGLEI